MPPVALAIMLLIAVIGGIFWLMGRDYDNLRKP